jgi:alpha-2-macroglobulin
MKYLSLGLASLLMSIFLFSSCQNKKNQLNISSRNFEDEVALQQNLQFTFDKDLHPDSLLQRWDTTQYIVFTPGVKGMFKWNAPSELIFSPAEGFSPGTTYKAALSPKLMNKSKRRYNLGNSKEITFHTPSLQVINTHLSWTRSMDMSSVLVQLDLDFNYDIAASEAAAHLQLRYNGRPVQFNTVAATGNRSISVQFLPLNDKR